MLKVLVFLNPVHFGSKSVYTHMNDPKGLLKYFSILIPGQTLSDISPTKYKF